MTNSKYNLQILDEKEYPSWDTFVELSPQGTLFHTTQWARIIEHVFKRSFEILVLNKNDHICAGILYWPKKVMFLNAITNIPNTTYQGIIFQQPISTKSSTVNAEYQQQVEIILNKLTSEFHLIDIPLSPGIVDIRPFEWAGFKAKTSYTYTFPIIDFEMLKKQFSQDLRRKIKKILNSENVFKESTETKLVAQFVMDSYKKHNTSPAISQPLLKAFMDNCIENKIGRLFYQHSNGKPVAGIFILSDNKTIYALFSGISKTARNEINSELLHTFILIQPEFIGKNFDFLGANTQYFEQFKRSFGGNLGPYFKVNYTRNLTIKPIFLSRLIIHKAKRKLKSFY
ncbi:MAG: GNAT family N-acetyltransferase [Calditrichaeota bacterium]|nr:MAG: GNAT family N-acetyltransferase [Calditrichota bacterium]MBL1207310.1 GNAT family N-acetyltransferase [Calditrichota bacterium]NOG47142.1 GNAT family N-acetyltransferase [Calditrichota bacterium]